MAATSLLEVSSNRIAPSTSLLRAPGAFLWWYADLFDHEGNGAVLIWSYGLPFLPSCHHRRDVPAASPSLNLVLYRNGQETFYLLEEYAPRDVHWRDNHWHFGRSEIRLEENRETAKLTANLDVPVPGGEGRLRGELQIGGPHPRWVGSASTNMGASSHDWCLGLARAAGSGELMLSGKPHFSVKGSGYHDSNSGARPLHELGIHRWLWGRVPFEDREWIVYFLWPDIPFQAPTLHVFQLAEDGTIEVLPDVSLHTQGRRMGRYGMPFWKELTVFSQGQEILQLTLEQALEDGPFYLRFLARARDPAGRTGRGPLELCLPSRVQLPLLRPLVRMRVAHAEESNSFWLPLFSGPAGDRIARQWKQAARALTSQIPPRGRRMEARAKARL